MALASDLIRYLQRQEEEPEDPIEKHKAWLGQNPYQGRKVMASGEPYPTDALMPEEELYKALGPGTFLASLMGGPVGAGMGMADVEVQAQAEGREPEAWERGLGAAGAIPGVGALRKLPRPIAKDLPVFLQGMGKIDPGEGIIREIVEEAEKLAHRAGGQSRFSNPEPRLGVKKYKDVVDYADLMSRIHAPKAMDAVNTYTLGMNKGDEALEATPLQELANLRGISAPILKFLGLDPMYLNRVLRYETSPVRGVSYSTDDPRSALGQGTGEFLKDVKVPAHEALTSIITNPRLFSEHPTEREVMRLPRPVLPLLREDVEGNLGDYFKFWRKGDVAKIKGTKELPPMGFEQQQSWVENLQQHIPTPPNLQGLSTEELFNAFESVPTTIDEAMKMGWIEYFVNKFKKDPFGDVIHGDKDIAKLITNISSDQFHDIFTSATSIIDKGFTK